ncbi:MAG: exported protein of unknown function [Mycobacterium sp.]|nr:exported protein of unknown function [Mycobacterium sp.]
MLVTFVGIALPIALPGGKDSTLITQNSGNNTINSNNTSTNNTYNGCFQLCSGVNSGDQAAQPRLGYDPEAGCTRDPSNTSVRAGWGPGRNVLAKDQFSEFPSFNIDNLPELGDERGFYDGRDFGTKPPYVWHYDVKVERGKTYILRILIHNSAPSNRPDLAATVTRVMVNLPNCTGRRIASQAFITSDNAEPNQIWGGVTFVGDEIFNLSYIEGSAVLCTNHYVCDKDNKGGVTLSDDLLTSHGVLIGSKTLDGKVLGGYENSALLMFEVRPQFAGA